MVTPSPAEFATVTLWPSASTTADAAWDAATLPGLHHKMRWATAGVNDPAAALSPPLDARQSPIHEALVPVGVVLRPFGGPTHRATLRG